LRWICLWTRSTRALLAGDTEEAERLTNEAFELGSSTGQPDALVFLGGQLYAIRWHQGRDGELFEMLGQVAEDSPNLPVIKAGIARMLCEAGRSDEVEVVIDELAALPRDLVWSLAMAMWSEVAVHVGDRDAAAYLYEQMAPHEEAVVYVQAVCAGAVAHYLGMLASMLGRPDDANRHFDVATRLHERLGAPFLQARTALEWARSLATRDPEAGREQAMRALELAQRFGCAEVERRAAALLAG
jgi:tetratricopeptide (TPR) repeat protein